MTTAAIIALCFLGVFGLKYLRDYFIHRTATKAAREDVAKMFGLPGKASLDDLLAEPDETGTPSLFKGCP